MIEVFSFIIALICGVFGMHRLFLLGLFWQAKYRERHSSPSKDIPDTFPRITIQLPVYNERYVIKRLIDAVCGIRYPTHLLDIQVLDDSDDDTRQRVDAIVAEKRKQKHPIAIFRREDRTGFKGGALQFGLTQAKGEWILIFDSDFIPQPDLLEKTVLYLQEPEVGMIQFCWDHINRNFSLLTRVQALFLDGHFHIEHYARNRSGRFFNFNGTAGMWRKESIIDSGGWQYDTLTEDMDLSYRAQMNGWKFLYVPEITVQAELPVELNAFKSQQFRWAKGGIQTARKILPSLLASGLPWRIKIEGVFHMLANVMYIVLALMILLIPFILNHLSWMPLYAYESVLMFSFFSVFVFYLAAAYGGSWQSVARAFRDIPILMAVGIGLCINNSRAVLEGFFSDSAVFVRTPKYNVRSPKDPWKNNIYRIRRLPLFWMEFFFFAYLTTTLLYSIRLSVIHVVPYLLIFNAGFFYFVTVSLKQVVWQRT